MDRTTARLSEYAHGLRYEDLSSDVVHRVKRAVLDALGCAVGGFPSHPAAIARRLAAQVDGRPPSPVIGTTHGSSADLAAFANTVMIRHLDCNDVYFAARGNGAHPSDMIPAVFACAPLGRPDGRTAITAIALAYEVLGWCSDTAPFTNLGGWDYGLFTVVGAALAAGKVLGLDRDGLAEAVSLALVPNVPLGVTRRGLLSMWKGGASASATRAGTFAAQLAEAGMTGPAEPFEGEAGLREQLGGEWVPPDEGALGIAPMAITRTSLKRYPSQSHTQGPIGLALALRKKLGAELNGAPEDGDLDLEIDAGLDAEDLVAAISTIRVCTFGAAVAFAATGPARWAPTTRETADHSIPYTVATALLDGDITPASFDDDRLEREATRRLIATMTVDEEPAFTAAFPGEERCRLELVTRSGRRLTAELAHPLGHRGNPLTDEQLEEKFHRLASAVPASRREEARRAVWALDELPDVTAILSALGSVAEPAGAAAP